MRRGLNKENSGAPQQGQKQEPKTSHQVTLHVPPYMAEAADVISRAVAIEQSAVVRMLVNLGLRTCNRYDLHRWANNLNREKRGSTTSRIYARMPNSMMNEINKFVEHANVTPSAAIRAFYQCGLMSISDYTLAEILDISIDSSNADDVKIMKTLKDYNKAHKKEVSLGVEYNYLQLADAICAAEPKSALLAAEPRSEYITKSSRQAKEGELNAKK